MVSHFYYHAFVLIICDLRGLAMREVFAGYSTPTPEALSSDDPEVYLLVRRLHQVRIETPLMEPLPAGPSAGSTVAALDRRLPVEDMRVADAAVHQILSV